MEKQGRPYRDRAGPCSAQAGAGACWALPPTAFSSQGLTFSFLAMEPASQQALGLLMDNASEQLEEE